MNHLIAHALVQNEQGEILIIKRTIVKRGKPNYQGGKWDIPGGTVEHLELPRAAAEREVKEEVGLDVTVTGILYETSNLDAQKQAVFTTLIYRCTAERTQDIVLDLEEHDAYRWVTAQEILSMDNGELVLYMKDVARCL